MGNKTKWLRQPGDAIEVIHAILPMRIHRKHTYDQEIQDNRPKLPRTFNM